ncbi:MAG: hypothetical protein MMC33_002635 [Icmadophila ericetorum]|nr:hypothetical protein [Icmadophila ericetorum]
MKTFPLHNIYAGFISESGSNVNQLVQAVADFVDPVYGGSLDPKAAMDANLFFDSQTRITSCLSSLFYNSSIVGTPAAFANFTAIPTFSSTLSTRPFTNWLNETLVYGNTPSRELWTAISPKSTPAAIKLAGDIFRSEVQTLRPVVNGTFTITWQPITTAYIAAARANGGDAIDLDPANGPIMGKPREPQRSSIPEQSVPLTDHPKVFYTLKFWSSNRTPPDMYPKLETFTILAPLPAARILGIRRFVSKK